ncbi:MAG TPA: DUF3048 domain-containing protein [Anaerolineales bacterium]|nr:DUF3048 domain-containing protein [Anaerolineales bacterium]
MRHAFIILVTACVFLAGCDIRANSVAAGGIPTPTPFQPQQTASDSLYAGAAPTPLSLPTVTPPPITSVEPTLVQNVEVTPVTLPAPLNPLTGLPASDPELLNRRPMAIKVANYPRYIRPQSGLTLADQVFEYYIEGGLTRFIAVFYGNDSEWVGPVRSGRFFDENIQRMYQSFLVFKFADPRVLSYFKTTDFADFLVVPSLGACPPFQLLPSRHIEVYNNSYFNTVLWKDCIEKENLPNDPPSYRSGIFDENNIPQSDLAGDLIYTYYSEDDYNYWSYVPETGEYARYQETGDTRDNKSEKYAPLVDRVNATAVHASNVVVLFAYHTFANNFDADDEVFHIDLTGSGEAYVFRDGIGAVARWHRTYANQPLVLNDAVTGAAIYLKPGITFYEVIGTNSYVDQDAGEWHFHHTTP